jgi:hypothetical protein
MVAAMAILSALALISSPRSMPPLTTDGDASDGRRPVIVSSSPSSSSSSSPRRSPSSDYGARRDHPTSYDDDPPFKGPLSLSRWVGSSPDSNRVRIRRHYLDSPSPSSSSLSSSSSSSSSFLDAVDGSPPPTSLGPSTPTDVILRSVVDHLARRDAPVDAKEVAESVEFYLRCGKRLLGAARRALPPPTTRDHHGDGGDDDDDDDDDCGGRTIDVQDLCSGHGLTGLIFLACNPPGRAGLDGSVVVTTLVDRAEPKSHSALRDIIAEVCPWVGSDGAASFVASTLEEFAAASSSAAAAAAVDDDDENLVPPGEEGRRRLRRRRQRATSAMIVISTHACGSLTDAVLEYAADVGAASIAVMPCCYTGTADGAPYGVRRMLGVGMAADLRRAFELQGRGDYHVDFAAVPRAITPMNRIIVAERRR